MRRTQIRHWAAICVWVGFGLATATARDYFVRPDGDDAGPGSAEQPFATIAAAIYELVPGDTLYLGDGVYYEGEFYPEVAGDPQHPITIRNVPGEQPILDGQYALWNFVELIEQDGFVFEGLVLRHYYDMAISCRNTGYVTVRQCIAHGNGSAGIALNYASYPHADYDAHMVIEDNICYENGWGIGWASGIHVNNKGEGSDTAHVIRRNICFNNYDGSSYHTDGNGIMFDIGGGGSCLIENNVCFNNGGAGIRAMDGRVDILHNTCFRNGWDQDNPYQPCEIELIERHLVGAVNGSTVRNNIMWSRPQRAYQGASYGGVFRAEDVPSSAFDFSHNVMWSDVPSEVTLESWMAACLVAAPTFIAAPSVDQLEIRHGATFLAMSRDDYDFPLHVGSPGIDHGLTGLVGEDLRLMPRPRHVASDCGAYEYVGCGDCDGDGITQGSDLTSATPCVLGPATTVVSTCVCLDHDGDGDVDLADVALHQTVTTD